MTRKELKQFTAQCANVKKDIVVYRMTDSPNGTKESVKLAQIVVYMDGIGHCIMYPKPTPHILTDTEIFKFSAYPVHLMQGGRT